MNNLHTTDYSWLALKREADINHREMVDDDIYRLHVRVVAFEWHELDVCMWMLGDAWPISWIR
jgi:hypothetical protein